MLIASVLWKHRAINTMPAYTACERVDCDLCAEWICACVCVCVVMCCCVCVCEGARLCHSTPHAEFPEQAMFQYGFVRTSPLRQTVHCISHQIKQRSVISWEVFHYIKQTELIIVGHNLICSQFNFFLVVYHGSGHGNIDLSDLLYTQKYLSNYGLFWVCILFAFIILILMISEMNIYIFIYILLFLFLLLLIVIVLLLCSNFCYRNK